MPRAIVPLNVIIQIDNSIQQPVFGAPVLISNLSVVIDDEGKPLYQPAHLQMPASSDDFTDDMLQALNNKLSQLGLRLVKDEI